MPKSHRTSSRPTASVASPPACLPPDLQPLGNAAAAELLQSREDAPTCHPGDAEQEDEELMFPWDGNKWLLEKGSTTVFEKLVPKAGVVADAPLELGDDRNHEAERHEAEELAARQLFDWSVRMDEEEAHEALREQRRAEQNDWLSR